jgi:ketosteroid isomerase-like protein
MTSDERIRALILRLNEAWQAGRFNELADFYHPDVVLLPPDAGEPIRGRAAVVASYREFAEAATLIEFQVTGMDVFEFSGSGGSSVCHMRFEIEYETAGQRFRESGLEVYVMSETSDSTQPVILWRSQAVLDAEEIVPTAALD